MFEGVDFSEMKIRNIMHFLPNKKLLVTPNLISLHIKDSSFP